jgi:hypothetical protein
MCECVCVCEIRGSHSDDYGADCPLGCNAV